MNLTDAIHIEVVEDWGPACGCGKTARLRHHIGGLNCIGARDVFLCVSCAQRAMEGFIRITGQPRYGPAVVSAKYQGFWCPDCGARETHKDSCAYFPGQPVVHGNRTAPNDDGYCCPRCGAPSASPPAEVYCVRCATTDWDASSEALGSSETEA